MNCYFAQFTDEPCGYPIDPCHIVRQQDIRREWELANPRRRPAWHEPNGLTGTNLQDLLKDRRNIVSGCRHHHARADTGWLPYEPPQSAREFAVQYDLTKYLPPEPE